MTLSGFVICSMILGLPVIKLQAMLKKGTVMQDEFVAMNSSLPITKAMDLVRKRTGWHISKMITAKGCGYKVREKNE